MSANRTLQDKVNEFLHDYARFGALLGACGMTVLTAFVAWWALGSFVVVATSPYTETTAGTITKLMARELPPRPTGRLVPRHCVELEYTYEVDGQEFTGTRYRPGDSGPISASLVVTKLLADYHIGDPVTVYYNHADAADAILEPPHAERDRMELLVFCVILTVAMWGAAIALTLYNPWAV